MADEVRGKARVKIFRGDALNMVKVPDGSVDLIVTSPPYFGQRVYLDDAGNVIEEAVGSEATPGEYLAALGVFMDEAMRVLKPSGSVFVNLGDKMAGSGGHNNASIQGKTYDAAVMTRDGPIRYPKSSYVGPNPEMKQGARDGHRRSRPGKVEGVRRKSLIGLPWRFALSQIDRGWVLRAEIIWDKPNGMPESVTDRVRRTHEQWFHFTKSERYFAAMDELREPTTPQSGKAGTFKRNEEIERWVPGQGEVQHRPNRDDKLAYHELGKLPGSVQRVSTGGVRPTKQERAKYNLPDHFAPFPPEWPRFFILGWTPIGWCGKCSDPVVPTVERTKMEWRPNADRATHLASGAFPRGESGTTLRGTMTSPPSARIVGYGCKCESPHNPTPSVVLDPFAGTGTTALVARILNRDSISLDISDAYVRLMNWRLRLSDHESKLVKKWKKKGLL